MSGHIDDVLSLIDGGLQSSPECGMVRVLPGRCSRCVEREPVGDSGFCGPCRAFLLGDGPDPELGSASYFRAPDGLLILDDIDGEPGMVHGTLDIGIMRDPDLTRRNEITVWSEMNGQPVGQVTIPAPFDHFNVRALIGTVFPFNERRVIGVAAADLVAWDGWALLASEVADQVAVEYLPDGITIRISADVSDDPLRVPVIMEWCSADPAFTEGLG